MNLNWNTPIGRDLYRLLSAWVLLILLLVISSAAHAACSSWRSPQKAWFNEYFFGSGGSAPPNFLEVYSTNNAFPASWQGWSIDVYPGKDTKTTYPLDTSKAIACTVSNKTWLTTNVPGGLRQQNALVLLKDNEGAYVDAFVFDNSAPPEPWPGTSASSWFPGLDSPSGCPELAKSLTSQAEASTSKPKQFNMLVLNNYGNKDMARDPDGGPRWDLTSNTGSGTTYTQCVSNNANFTKTVDNATPTPGSTVTFTLNLANTGSSTMSGVKITDFLPPVLTYISSTPSNALDPAVALGTYTATDPNTGVPVEETTTVTWSPAPVAAGTVSKLNIKMQVPADAKVDHTYVNTAQTTAGLTDNQTDFANITIGSPSTPSFAISVSPATSTTCTPAELGPKVTITAMSAANGTGTPLTNYNGTVTLTASTPNPRWYNTAGVRLSGNTVTLTNGSVILYLGDSVAETFTVSAVDAVYASPNVMQGSSGNITFTDDSSGLTLTDVDMLTPAYGAVAGRPHAVMATVSTCGSTAATTTGQYSGTIYYVPGLNHPTGAAGPTINPSSASCPGTVVPPLTTGGTPITLNFSAGQATFYLCTTDVGQYALRLNLNGIPSGTNTVTGISSNFTVRPFVITATGFAAGSTTNPAGASAFAKAGAPFSGTLSAWRWVANADTEVDGTGAQRGNGLPDASVTTATIATANPGLTARFNGTTNNAGVVSLAPILAPPANAPADTTVYTLGTLSPNTATLASGTATLTNAFSYSEVGNFKVGGNGGSTYAVTNYLGAAQLNVPILSDVVGRITPDHFTLTSPNITRRPVCLPNLPDSTFTYMDETFTLGFTLTARNASGDATQNYRNSYAFLNLFDPNDAKWSSLSVSDRNTRFAAQWASTAPGADGSFGLGAFQDSTDYSTRMRVASAAAGGWVNGSNKIDTNVSFARNAAAQDGPFATMAMGVVPRDTDGITVRLADLNLNGSRVSVGNNNFRFGRLALFSASAQGQANIKMPVQAQYWSGKSWILNNADNCTRIAASALRAANYRDAKSNAMSAWPVTLGGEVKITGGVGEILLTKPADVNAGTVDICADLGTDPSGGVTCAATAGNHDYLKGKWAPGTTFQNDPAARATFGIYTPETRRAVHIRELF